LQKHFAFALTRNLFNLPVLAYFNLNYQPPDTSPMTRSLSFLSIFLLAFTLFTNPAFASDKKLVGHWKGGKVDLNLKSNHRYTYKLKIFNFKGTWSTTGNKLIMKYTLAGFKKSKTAKFRFDGKDLILTMPGKAAVRLKKK